jgi:phage gpG-like protein
VASVGTSVGTIPYARIHEWGGTIVPKTADYLVFKTPDGAWHKVKQVVIPERSYLRSSLGDKKLTIEQQVRASAARAAAKAGFK